MSLSIDDPRWTAYALDELDAEQRAALEVELKDSPAAQQSVAELRSFAVELARALEAEPACALSEAQRAALVPNSAVATVQVQSSRGRRWWLPDWANLVWAGAGAVVAVVALGLLQRQAEPQWVQRAAESVPTRAPAGVNALDQTKPSAEPAVPSAELPSEPAASASGVEAKPEAAEAEARPEAALAGVPPAPASGPAPVTTGPAESEVPAAAAASLAPLALDLPIPAFMGTPTDLALNEHMERPSDKPRPPFLAPVGTKLVSVGKPVTTSDRNPINGAPELVTDGNKEAGDANVLELHRKVQWVQIDLEAAYRIYAVLVWHAHDTPQIVHDVVVQVADDADFTRNVRTLFNNDYDNSAGLGAGRDKEYFENYEGRLIDARGATARYLRLFSQGSTYTALNRYTEVEVYGLPAGETQAPAASSAGAAPQPRAWSAARLGWAYLSFLAAQSRMPRS